MTTLMRRGSARALIPSVAAVAVIALAVAGCGGSSGGSGGGGYGAASPAKPAAGYGSGGAPTAKGSGGTSVGIAESSLGKILVDSKGETLYLFEADKGSASTCDGACAKAWPPLTTTGDPAAASGVSASKLGTTMRSDGETEVTYNGHPLYTFAGDGGPGATTGQGVDAFGAEWDVVSPAGTKVESEG